MKNIKPISTTFIKKILKYPLEYSFETIKGNSYSFYFIFTIDDIIELNFCEKQLDSKYHKLNKEIFNKITNKFEIFYIMKNIINILNDFITNNSEYTKFKIYKNIDKRKLHLFLDFYNNCYSDKFSMNEDNDYMYFIKKIKNSF